MGDKSAIEWCDATWNCVTGCDKVSPGCAHCYAETIAIRLWAKSYHDGVPTGRHDASGNGPEMRPRKFTDVMCHEDRLDQPLRWKKPRRIFVNSMSDLFHESVPDAFIDRVFAVMALAPQHTFQILTKRADRMRAYLTRPGKCADVAVLIFKMFTTLRESERESLKAVKVWPLPNVWLGVSVENQHFADERIPLLLQTPAAVRFISAEPLLGPVDLERIENTQNLAEGQRYIHALKGYAWDVFGADHYDVCSIHEQLDWIIVGGESGSGARPFDLAWARSIVAQCQAAGVPCFVKQVGAKPILDCPAGEEGDGQFRDDGSARYWTVGFIKDRKGGDPDEWPADLRVRQFPEVPRV